MKRTNVLWITALLLGWFFDFLFWKHAQGLNFALYVVLCLAGGLLVLGLNGLKPAWRSLLLLIPILFFAAMTFIRQEPLSLFLSFRPYAWLDGPAGRQLPRRALALVQPAGLHGAYLPVDRQHDRPSADVPVRKEKGRRGGGGNGGRKGAFPGRAGNASGPSSAGS